ncbi:MAG: hypothetical protein Q9M91_08640 [Candidatus Dojkabacteria bacterium]|nr:hypothetical protein [Candidatus Dojkabacteria bacterium]MDQ7021839.1 hypothetical protein [Candidatus Dojkabacteria bacterium]
MKFRKERITELLEKIKIAKVLSVEKHENADRLLVVQITDGDKEFQIVTGASNFKPGDLVPFLGVGEVVPGFLFKEGKEIKLEKRPLRGVDSEGMILAEDEIGTSEDHTRIRVIEGSELEMSIDDAIGKSILDATKESFYIGAFNQYQEIEITPKLQERIDLIMSVGSEETGGEVIGEDQLAGILTSGEDLYTYDGFEPSGQMHIAQGIIRAINTNKMIKAGFTFRMYVADWFGYLNNKMGGDLEKIKDVGKYFIEIWKASGMDLDNTEFIWTSDVIKDPKYWEIVMKVSKSATLKRILRTTEIMGRSEDDDLSGAQIIYPCMQTTDIFHVMKCQVTELGMDQRKVNMLAREVGPSVGYWKPVVVSHGMLQGLQKPMQKSIKLIKLKEGRQELRLGSSQYHIEFGQGNEEGIQFNVSSIGKGRLELISLIENDSVTKFGVDFKFVGRNKEDNLPEIEVRYHEDPEAAKISQKMSKSKPDTAIFMTDSEEDVKRKIMAAYCPPEEISDNPILGYCKQIIFEAHHLKLQESLLEDGVFKVEREDKFGGDVSYNTYQELEESFRKGVLFPLDLKLAVIKYLNKLLTPVRAHFTNNNEAKELLERVQSYQVTR